MVEIATAGPNLRPGPKRWSGLARGPLSLAFATVACTSVWMPRWVVGLPVRTMLEVVLLVLAMVASPRAIRTTITRRRGLFLIIAATAAIGALVSAANECPTVEWLQQLQEIQVQAAITLLLSAVLVSVIGRGRFGAILLFAIGVSIVFSLLQAAGVEAAWQARADLGRLQADDILTQAIYLKHARALGLSLTPINLATQLTLAFAIIGLLRQGGSPEVAKSGRRFRPTIIIAALAMAGLCFASGNRSPILGFVVFIPVYLAVFAPRLSLFCLPFALAAAPFAYSMTVEPDTTTGLRALNTDDSSAAGRLPLAKLGVLEFLDRPYGYGLCFDSTLYAQKFWPLLFGYDNAKAVFRWPLHNYFLMMLNKYGGLLLIVFPLVLLMMWKNVSSALLFVPYLVHISFHNDGPLLADFMFWFVVALTPNQPRVRPLMKHPSQRIGLSPTTEVEPRGARLDTREVAL